MLGDFFLEQKTGRVGRFFSGAENRRVVGVFFLEQKKNLQRQGCDPCYTVKQ